MNMAIKDLLDDLDQEISIIQDSVFDIEITVTCSASVFTLKEFVQRLENYFKAKLSIPSLLVMSLVYFKYRSRIYTRQAGNTRRNRHD